MFYRNDQVPNFQPLVSTGDGNCLYNSVSTILFGSESYSSSLRLASLLHGLKHYDHYLAMVSHAVGLVN